MPVTWGWNIEEEQDKRGLSKWGEVWGVVLKKGTWDAYSSRVIEERLMWSYQMIFDSCKTRNVICTIHRRKAKEIIIRTCIIRGKYIYEVYYIYVRRLCCGVRIKPFFLPNIISSTPSVLPDSSSQRDTSTNYVWSQMVRQRKTKVAKESRQENVPGTRAQPKRHPRY